MTAALRPYSPFKFLDKTESTVTYIEHTQGVTFCFFAITENINAKF